ncbi:DNA ligase I, ATP-dependent (dnl1) [Spizellomyces punctatus DAOM BR117]|uniref:DNA ligase n=1 Tax=Spizellomyces punctatus (strain DAOM BR117) TaxID=645134 RepID=A0A0L0HH29_SPIPD|nr:DNA ligase I, ATP-dependent (dnl1) [Spizellomyces punctatus DAOM BR117]KND00382.1 DNA ligase I, ATP-dependent (dnl1) [Spizellomyces punctatus DAOM BR117]|eukprot:XP_016608421.1 DNA ligase I, ATP-dependent (dnl1) [Spizellomyces punctatus DAOM BR117]
MAGKKQMTLASFWNKGGKPTKEEVTSGGESIEPNATGKAPGAVEPSEKVRPKELLEDTAVEDIKNTVQTASQKRLSEDNDESDDVDDRGKENMDIGSESSSISPHGAENGRRSPRKRTTKDAAQDSERPSKKARRIITDSESDTDIDSDKFGDLEETPTTSSSEKKTTQAEKAPRSTPRAGSDAALRPTGENATAPKDRLGEHTPEADVSDGAEADTIEEEVDDAKIAKATAKMVTTGSLTSKAESLAWKKGSPVPYAALCKTFEQIESTTKRLQILAFLTAFFKDVIQLSPKDLVACIYLCLNRIGPEYEGKELGIGESILVKAVASATGRSAQSIKTDMAQHGDLGTVAQTSRGHQKTMFPPPPLTVVSVYKTLNEIASITGQSSQSLKIGKINKLLVACRDNEPKYLIRSLEGKLRIGLAEQSILQALAHAATLTDSSVVKLSEDKRATVLAEAAATFKHVYNELPNYDEIVPVLLEKGIKELPKYCKLRPGVPLKPMLAHPTKSLTDVLNRFENMTFTCEYKYDGERAQIHLLEYGKIVIYSRNSENLSAKYPDIIEAIPKIPKEGVKSFVLDCEAVAWDRQKQCILPFQVLSTRKRKDVQAADIQVQVCVFAFDLLYLNGEPLTTKHLKDRRDVLYEHFNEVDGVFAFAKHKESSNVEEIQTFLDEAVEGNCEGLMVKTLVQEASYEPSKRSRNWLKVKKDYLSGVGDTFDLVVIGGYIGRGKRTGWYGGYLLACYDEDREEYQSICKIGTGFSEEQLAEHAKFFKDHIIDRPKSYYQWSDTPNLRPDVWFDAVQVWEVKAADLSISPVHKAAIGHVDPNKGISLRFPRFMRVRDDKKPEQATNASQVADFYRSQKINSAAGELDDE